MKDKNTLLQASQIFSFIRQTCNAEGYWSGDHRNWDDIVAVRNLEYLLLAGCNENECWKLYNEGIEYDCSIKKIFNFINKKMVIKDNECCFGEDFWDLLELLIFIERNKLFKQFPSYNKFKKYAISLITDSEFFITNNKWSGVGVIVSAIKYFKLIKLPYTKLLDIIKKHKNENGTYGDESDILSTLWHTSQVVSILGDCDEDKIKAFESLKNLIRDTKFLSDYNRNYYLAYIGIAYIENNLSAFNSDKEFVYDIIIQEVKNGTLATDRCALSALSQFYIAILKDEMSLVKTIALKDIIIPSYDSHISMLIAENKKMKKALEKFENSYPINKKVIKALIWFCGIVLTAAITAIVTIIITKHFT